MELTVRCDPLPPRARRVRWDTIPGWGSAVRNGVAAATVAAASRGTPSGVRQPGLVHGGASDAVPIRGKTRKDGSKMVKITHVSPEDDDPSLDQEGTLTFPARMRLGTDEDLLRDFGSGGPLLGSPVRPTPSTGATRRQRSRSRRTTTRRSLHRSDHRRRAHSLHRRHPAEPRREFLTTLCWPEPRAFFPR